MAENHPVGFQWVMEAKERGAKIIHVDPRFSRTSAVSDLHVPIRPGTDIAFLGAIVHHILENDLWFEEYVKAYTNASTIICDEFTDTEDQLDDVGAAQSGEAGRRAGGKPTGLFSGFDSRTGEYDPSSWQYAGMEAWAAGGQREQRQPSGEQAHGAHGGGSLNKGEPPQSDPTLQDPRCVFQILKRHFSRYTPDAAADICGVPAERIVEVAEAMSSNSGRERTSAFCYAVGWTQHTTGTQYIRTASIIQLLLGNMGRPGGGIVALRGHASIQGSTDIPTLFNILPGYLPMPNPNEDPTLKDYVEANTAAAGFWGHTDCYIVSLLKAWWGDAATADNDFCFDHLPRITGDHSHYPTILEMQDGKVEGYFVMGQNPVVGSANSRLHRMAMTKLKWLVVRDLQMIETATFWQDSHEIESGEVRSEDIDTEVFFLPGASHTEKDGTFTNTQRLLQWHNRAVEPPGDCRSELWFMYHLGRRIREKLAGSADPKDRAILDLTWDYPTEGPEQEPSAEAVLREISGYDSEDRALDGYPDLGADGSTASGCWIYSGAYADEVNQPARRRPGQEQDWVALGWGWAWPLNRRTLYNRASADPQGNPWSERKRYVWWDSEQGRWTGHDVPDFKATMRPDHVPGDDDTAEDALRGDSPFVMQADGRGWLFVPAGLTDGPLPTHYEPHESPVENLLYGQQSNPAREEFPRRDNAYNPSAPAAGAGVFPFVMTTYRLTEHHTAGGMSRWLPYLSELQPEMFVEVSPALARERGLEHGGWAAIVTSRSGIEARVMVTERIRPLKVRGRTIQQVGLPYHWGRGGLSTGDAANELLSVALDPNSHIGDYKAATCDVRPGRRPRGAELDALVASYRDKAGVREG